MIRISGESAVSNDRDLERRVRDFLTAHNIPALRRLAIEARGGTVTLRGQVSTFYEKQLSQQCPRRVDGVQRLIDQVVVRPLRANDFEQRIVNGEQVIPRRER